MSIAQTAQEVDLVTMIVAGQLVGVPMAMVRDVLGPQRIFAVPKAPREIAGVLNLRGRIVTVVDLRARLGLPESEAGRAGMSVVVEHQGELCSLRIDEVGEALRLPAERFEPSLVALDQHWREVAVGVHRLKDGLLVELDVGRVLDLVCAA
jgi:purine-binding chemotaxis protein CheW